MTCSFLTGVDLPNLVGIEVHNADPGDSKEAVPHFSDFVGKRVCQDTVDGKQKTKELREFQQDFSAIYRAPYHWVHQNRKVNPLAPPVDPRIGHLRDDGWKIRFLLGDEAYDDFPQKLGVNHFCLW
ncbi:hypothetical protein NMY22_g3420 [Coprinellus aureogranulatus]|nr:hypothetical protein NMY22_g3420 [Coprinellus aureogranulatus]